MAITAVGSTWQVRAANVRTLSVSPTALGDCIVLSIKINPNTLVVRGVAGGGVTTWTRIAGPYSYTSPGTHVLELWLGQVTATGSATITVDADNGGATDDLMAQQFTAGSGVAWSLDDAQSGNLYNSTSSATVNCPTLTATLVGELYFARAICSQMGLTSGQTAGYTVVLDGNNNILMWNPNVSGSQSPIAKQSASGTSRVLAALVQATSGLIRSGGGAAGGGGTGTEASVLAPGISAVGSIAGTEGSGTATFTVDTTTIGNAVVVGTRVTSSSLTINSMSGGGCDWTLAARFVSTARGRSYEIWIGQITSVVTGSTVTASWSGSLTGKTCTYNPQEFTFGSPANWDPVSGQTGGTETSTTSLTITFPTLTASAKQLYFGQGSVSSGVPTGSGSPAGFVFEATTDCWCYGVTAGAGSIAVSETNNSTSQSAAVGALIEAVPTGVVRTKAGGGAGTGVGSGLKFFPVRHGGAAVLGGGTGARLLVATVKTGKAAAGAAARGASVFTLGGGQSAGYRSGSSATVSQASTITIARPAGVTFGDLLIAVVGQDSDGSIASLTAGTSGFTQFGTDGTELGTSPAARVWYRAASGGEPATYTFGCDQFSVAVGIVVCLTGCQTNNPLDATTSWAWSTGTTMNAPSITAAAASMLVTAFLGQGGSQAHSTPAGMTEVDDVTTTWMSMSLDVEPRSTTGTTGTRTTTVTGAPTGNTLSVAFSVAGRTQSGSVFGKVGGAVCSGLGSGARTMVGSPGSTKTGKAAPRVMAHGPCRVTTRRLYAGTATAFGGAWADPEFAEGPTLGDFTKWTGPGAQPGATGILDLTDFGAIEPIVKSTSTPESVAITIRHVENPVDQVDSVTAQVYTGNTPVGSSQPLTVQNFPHEDTITVPWTAYETLAALKVRLTFVRTAAIIPPFIWIKNGGAVRRYNGMGVKAFVAAPPPTPLQTLGVGGIATPPGATVETGNRGAFTISAGGSPGNYRVYDGKGFTSGRITITGQYITVQNYRVNADGQYGIVIQDTSNVIVQNCDIFNVHAPGDLNVITMFGNNLKILFNTAVNPITGDPGSSHTDFIQTWVSSSHPTASTGWEIRGNRAVGPANPGRNNSVPSIHQCIMAEGAGHGGNSGGNGNPHDWYVADNEFSGSWGQDIKFDGVDNAHLTRNRFTGSSDNVMELTSGANVSFWSDNQIGSGYGSVGVGIRAGNGPATYPY